MTIYGGLDVHCKQSTYHTQDEQGRKLGMGQVMTTREGFSQLVSEQILPPGSIVGLETGTSSKWVSRYLSSLGLHPVVIDAREVRVKSPHKGRKSDRRDAFEICDGLRRGIFTSLVYVPNSGVDRLRVLLSRRRHFVKVRTMQTGAAKFLLRSEGLSAEAATLTTGCAWEKLLAREALACLRGLLEPHAAMWRQANETVQRLNEELVIASKPYDETLRRLQTVPGIGFLTAAAFLAVVADPSRFADSDALVGYVGLAPSVYDSGERERHGSITKQGSSLLRGMLCEAAIHAARPRHPLNPYFARVAARGGYKKAVIFVAQRLARILWQMWRKQEDFDPEKLNVVRETHQRTRTYYYRLRRPEERNTPPNA